MPDTTKIERQLQILSALSDNERGMTTKQIHAHLFTLGIETSLKSVSRDIDDLSISNFPIYEEKIGREVLFKAQKFRLENVFFSIDELMSLYFTSEILRAYSGNNLGKASLQLIDKIFAKMPGANRQFLDKLDDLVKVKTTTIIKDEEVDPEILLQINKAMDQNRKIEITYAAFNSGQTTTRLVEPYVLEIHDGCYHLVAFCTMRNSTREFRVSRIKAIHPTDQVFERKPGFYEEQSANRFDKLTGEKKINLVVRFSGDAAKYVKEYEADRADAIVDEGDRILFTKATTMTPEILKWVLGFGAEAEVLEPEELRKQVKQVVREMAKRVLGEYFN